MTWPYEYRCQTHGTDQVVLTGSVAALETKLGEELTPLSATATRLEEQLISVDKQVSAAAAAVTASETRLGLQSMEVASIAAAVSELDERGAVDEEAFDTLQEEVTELAVEVGLVAGMVEATQPSLSSLAARR